MPTARAEDIGLFLVTARKRVVEDGTEIEGFAERVRALRANVAPAMAGRATHEELLDPLRRRDDELTLAIEELRAQNEALADVHGRLERERAKYMDLYDNAPDAYVTTDARGIVQEANHAAAALLAVPRTVLSGKLLIAFVARRDTRVFRERLKAICDGGGTGTIHVKMRPRGGAPFVATLSVGAVHGLREHHVAFRWIIRPSESGPATAADAHGLLPVLVDELRAPLTTVLGWSRMLHEGMLQPGEHDGAIAAIAESALAQQGLLDQLAELVALAEDREPPQHVALWELVEQAVERARGDALARNVDLAIEGPPVDLLVRGHGHHLGWALDRLLAWTIEAVTPGSIRVRVVAHPARAVVQVHAPKAAALGGSRLAIAVARAAVIRHGGELRVPELAEEGVVCELMLPPDAEVG